MNVNKPHAALICLHCCTGVERYSFEVQLASSLTAVWLHAEGRTPRKTRAAHPCHIEAEMTASPKLLRPTYDRTRARQR